VARNQIWRFIKRHVVPSIALAVGAIIAIGSRVNDAYTLIHAGLPASAWEAIGLAIFFASVTVLLVRFYAEFSRTVPLPLASTARPTAAYLPEVAHSSEAGRPKPYLSEFAVFSGTADNPPRFSALFASNGRQASFYVKYRWSVPTYGGGWTSWVLVPVYTAERFTGGERLSLPLLRSVQTKEGLRWQFGEEMKNGFPVHMLGPDRWYQGKIKFLSEDNVEQYCSFILYAPREMSQMPDVVGEHMFSHLCET
jgi:hypothetical protein